MSNPICKTELSVTIYFNFCPLELICFWRWPGSRYVSG